MFPAQDWAGLCEDVRAWEFDNVEGDFSDQLGVKLENMET
jgi:hypothetical protein